MSPADAGPPIATINPANGELLQSFEPYDAAGVEDRLGSRGLGRPPVGEEHLRRTIEVADHGGRAPRG